MEAADFINKTLQRKPANRLGLNGPNEVKQHIWLKDVDWQSIIEMKTKATFIPGIVLLPFSTYYFRIETTPRQSEYY